MTCAKCNSQNVNVTVEQVSGKTKTRGAGFLFTIGRWMLILCTGGLWLVVGKKKGTGKTKFKNRTVAICQSCGNKWAVQQPA